MVGLELLAGAFGKRGSEFLMVESGSTGALLGINDDELLRTALQIIAIPEPRVVVKPMRADARFVNAALGSAESAATLLSGGVGLVGGRGLLLGKGGGERCEQGNANAANYRSRNGFTRRADCPNPPASASRDPLRGEDTPPYLSRRAPPRATSVTRGRGRE